MKEPQEKRKNKLHRKAKQDDLLKERLKESPDHLIQATNYAGYLVGLLKENSTYKLFSKVLGYFSGFRIVARIFKWVTLFFLALQTSAIFFIVALIILITLPLILTAFLFTSFLSAIKAKSDKPFTANAIKDKKVIVFFLSRNTKIEKNDFFTKNATELMSRGYAVLIISPFSFSPNLKTRFFINQHALDFGALLIKRQYFFFIKKNLLINHSKRVIYVY